MCGCLALSLLGTWPATQALALTGNQTGNPLLHRLALRACLFCFPHQLGLVCFVFFNCNDSLGNFHSYFVSVTKMNGTSVYSS